ncbi:MAG: asparagine synthetase B, partial [Candidatus Woesearchaeota archaeon]|nr:asparagine synthetase B [Candidatus Woesearchaeota archaeon]
MCGIIGLFNIHDHKSKAATALDCLKNRGKDYQKIISQKNYSLAHALHAVVSKVKQPFEGKGLLVANCEIYNWKEIAKTHAIQAKNDAHLIFQLLEKGESPGELVKKLDGVYSFAYVRDNKVLLVRDLIGVKPLWYGKNPGFGFASEKKALLKSGFKDINELNPRKILEYNLKTKKIKVRSQKFFTIGPEHRESKQKIKNKLLDLLTKAVDKRIPKPKFGLLFSGGVDSSTLALLLKKHKKKFTCYTTVLDHPGFKEPEDLVYAKKAAKTMNLNLKIIKVKLKEIKPLLKKIVPLIEDSNVVKVAVALTFYKACEQARKDGHKVLFSGLGAEELFGGYERHKKSLQINKECLSGLLKMYERDLYRDDIVSMENSVELRLPFLDHDLSKYSLNIPGKYKINSKGEKQILREVAEKLGVPKLIARRKKRAAQYGSNIQKALKKLAKPHPTISSYLDTFAPSTNPKLGALIS